MSTGQLNDAVVALQKGLAADAEQLCRDQLAHSPDDENLLLLLSLSLQQQGKLMEAVDGYATLAHRSPPSATHWTNYSTALRVAARPKEAAGAAREAIALEPGDATHHISLGLALFASNDHDLAQQSLLRACALAPHSPFAAIHAANALIAARDADAYELLRPWRTWLPLDAPEQLLLSHLLMTIGDAGDAYEVLLELTARSPMHLPARLRLVALHERKNDLEEAERLLAETVLFFPSMDAQATLEVAHLRGTLAMRQGRLGESRQILEATEPRTPIDYAHYFALADVLDKLGDTDTAIENLRIAHSLQSEEMTPLAPSRFEPGAAPLPNAIKRLREVDYGNWPDLRAPGPIECPVFIVGFPRSGTTLLEQMLDAHPALQSMDERPFFTILGNELAEHGAHVPEDIGRLSQRDCDELRKRYYGLVGEKIRRDRNARLVDKNPLNMLWVPLIVRLFPHAKFILALRHPCDVVLSNYMQNYRSTVLAGACMSLQRTAMAYVAAMESWLYHVELLRPQVLVSRYEELVDDPVRGTRRFAEFLGLDDAMPMLNYDRHAREKGFIATPSYTEVIRPVSRRRMDRWRRYEREFEPVLPILDPMLRHWQYEATLGRG